MSIKMLTEIEKQGFVSILKKLPKGDLISLKDTVTKGQITVEDSNEAIKVIISYSTTPNSLFKRKKIVRDYLFQYLHENGIVVSVQSDKQHLVNKILELWKSDLTNSQDCLMDDDSNSGGGDNSQRHTTTTPLQPVTLIQNTHINVHIVQGDQNITDGSLLTLPDPVPVYQNNQSGYQINQPTSDKFMTNSSSATDQLLAETFVKWFYKMMNSQNPSLNETPENFGPHHFWNDVRLRLLTVASDSENSTEQFEGCEMVSCRLLAITKDELLLFNPNLSAEGVRSKKDPHGLLAISVCGTIHRGNDCLGIFEQDFGLIRDPRFENNWKIKVTALNLRCSNVATMPKLEEGKDMLAIATISSTDNSNNCLVLQ
ncbi:uncharacterized protein C3orf38 homolog isoform X2 [Patella vulgata]|uniref:uncharacterized protein C3orf38 homolog isoform X2 n=1 Tax=Patella vulgata TaxID=6465 RepID=UPI0024A9B6C4|nr:uncharacterized protein C3orf38 homolog isoform X2 [Patella vulgata]